MKKTLLAALLLLSFGLRAQESGKDFYYAEFKWSIKLPEGFETLSTEEWGEIQQKGADAVEDTYDVSMDEVLKTNKVLFVLKSGLAETMEANVQPFDPATDGDYEELGLSLMDIMKTTLETQLPDVEVKTSSGKETIGGLEFYRNDLAMPLPNGTVFYAHMFSRLFDKKDFTVNIMYTDKAIGEKMLKAFRDSKFK